VDFLSGLNPQQQEAVATTEGPVLILAGAGSGKTKAITNRIAHLITAKHVPPSAILAVTFTNKAAAEMRSRVQGLLEGYTLHSPPQLATFHSFCVRLLRRDGDALASIRPGFTRTFSICDGDDQISIVKAAYKRLGLDDKAMPHRATLSQISQAKSQKDTPQELYNKATDPRMTKVAAVYEEYEKALRLANAMDFDDLLLETVRLLYHDQATRDAWNQRLSYLMIDEYQDTNRSQYELMRLLSQRHDNICVVGDEDQSIYSWRGADIRNILDFEKDFPRAKVIRLEQNYRSTKTILEASSVVIANNKERKGKWLWTEADEGDEITVYPAHDAENEALFIADTTEKILRQHKDWRVAVLYRTNSQSRQIEEAMRRYGRKYNVVGGTSYYQRAEVKDVIAYLKLATSQADAISLSRIINVPARGIGKTTLEQAEKFAAENGIGLWDAIERLLQTNQFGTRAHSAMRVFRELILELAEAVQAKPLNEALAFIEERTGYRRMLEQENTPEAEGRLENLNELMNAAAEAVERGETLSDFLDHAALVADSDSLDEAAQVTLMTIHNAKGLEFPAVFIAGLEEGLFPHGRSLNSEAAMEEERRLCYVGMTRAEKRLILTWAKLRRRFGGGEQERTIKSRFLAEVPQNLVVNLGIDNSDDSDGGTQVDLTSERYPVRRDAAKNLYTGKTYNSVENVQQFFKERGVNTPLRPTAQPIVRSPLSRPVPPPAMPVAPVATRPPAAPAARPAPDDERMPWDDVPAIQLNRAVSTPSARPVPPSTRPPAPVQGGLFGSSAPVANPLSVPRPSQLLPPPKARTELPKAPPTTKRPSQAGTVVEHPKYGTGTIVRREGEGDDAKLVVSFQRHGLKKLVEKYAGLKNR
jgi:DNA helicase-2/ATP-dependent DNA helicase PcrA